MKGNLQMKNRQFLWQNKKGSKVVLEMNAQVQCRTNQIGKLIN